MAPFSLDKLVIKNSDGKKIVDLFSSNQKNLEVVNSLALVGQSGSGKSLTLKTILKMLPPNLSKDFLYKSEFELNSKNIAFIPQNPFTSLSPMTKIKDQFFLEKQEFFTKDIDKLLDMVDLKSDIKNRFPVQLSGGQLQRVVIAIALSKKPKLLLLDEPTTALDHKTKSTIINLIKKLQEKLNFLMIFVSHDIDSIKTICEDIAILENGKIVETGKIEKVLQNPKVPYTKMLIESSFSNRKFRT